MTTTADPMRLTETPMATSAPILEFDPTPTAVIEPSQVITAAEVPEHCVVCFFREVVEDLAVQRQALMVQGYSNLAMYEITHQGKRLAFLFPGVGAPVAATSLEQAIALGCRKFIACGGCGALERELIVGHLIVPTSAVRDEGVSYHYLAPSREVTPSEAGVTALMETLGAHQVPYRVGKTWTTDAPFRETRPKIERRKAEGCIAVELESASLFAVAQFRRVTIAQVLYAGDDVSGDVWDPRDWQAQTSLRERLFWLAAEACLSLQ